MKWYDFSEIIEDKTGGNPKLKVSEYKDKGEIPVIDQGKRQISGYSHDDTLKYNYNKPLIIFGDHTCILKYIDFPFILGADGVKALEIKVKADTKYIYYFLKTAKIPDTGYDRHFKYLKRIKIPLPPIETQKRIAAILDKADELRRNDQKILEKYDQLAQSVFLEMFGDPVTNTKGWDKTRFDQVGSIERGVSKNRPRNAPELLGGKHPLIQTGDVANCELYIQEYDSTYSDIGLAQSKKWPKGTLCITIAANIAKTGILSFEACFPDSVVGFLPNEKTNIIYIHFWLSFLQKILESTAPESAQKNINLRILRELELPLPPIIEQNHFAEIIKHIETQKQLTQQSLQKSERLFQSLLQKAFREDLFL